MNVPLKGFEALVLLLPAIVPGGMTGPGPPTKGPTPPRKPGKDG